MIKRPKVEEISDISSLHLKSLKEGILYNLGHDILKLFYQEIFYDKHCFIWAYYINDRLAGVAASSEDSKKFLDKIKKKHFFKIALKVLKKSVKTPALPFRLILSKYQEIRSELVFLFVDEHHRGNKVGEELVNATTNEFRKRNIKNYNIAILSENVRGKKFYERLGFEKIKQFPFFGEKRDLYRYNIGN